MNKICLVIPCYRHADSLGSLLDKLIKYKLDIVIVDDGNSSEQKAVMTDAVKNFEKKLSDIGCTSTVSIVTHEVNLGKGYAVASGIMSARAQGYTHVIQIDSDGQHNTDDINKILKLIDEHPDCVISGRPVYDSSAPKARVIGRKITNFFVHVETLSTKIADAMIGFRAYPVEATARVIEKYNLRSRMNFDIEILVRLYWEKVMPVFFDTRVIYNENGISNFSGFKDNVKLSLMHTKLCTIMIFRTLFKPFL